jgi:hypothetical protein
MRMREKFVAGILTLGVSLLIFSVVIILPTRTERMSNRPVSPYRIELSKQFFRWGASICGVGCVLLLIVYLTRRWGVQRTYLQRSIIALFCTNQQGEMVLYPEGYAPHSLRYHVRLTLPNGESDEFECSLALFQQLREGLRGRAVCKGNQLLAFYPDADRMSGFSSV